jgi:hypothetical protein
MLAIPFESLLADGGIPLLFEHLAEHLRPLTKPDVAVLS